jgi:hypothetical protein
MGQPTSNRSRQTVFTKWLGLVTLLLPFPTGRAASFRPGFGLLGKGGR